jgi:hypothetical protein
MSMTKAEHNSYLCIGGAVRRQKSEGVAGSWLFSAGPKDNHRSQQLRYPARENRGRPLSPRDVHDVRWRRARLGSARSDHIGDHESFARELSDAHKDISQAPRRHCRGDRGIMVASHTMLLGPQFDAAHAEVTRLERMVAVATCEEIGSHDMQSIGGCNAGCADDCSCSVPVYTCTRCSECDYGDNDEARKVRRYCRKSRT